VDSGEKATLLAFLTYLRFAVLAKVEDVPDEEARRAGVPSGTVAAICASYQRAIARADAVIEAAPSLEQQSVGLPDGATKSLRWILLHNIEETARHAGHADILREQLDGSIGR
jgi:hypothetical protein